MQWSKIISIYWKNSHWLLIHVWYNFLVFHRSVPLISGQLNRPIRYYCTTKLLHLFSTCPLHLHQSTHFNTSSYSCVSLDVKLDILKTEHTLSGKQVTFLVHNELPLIRVTYWNIWGWTRIISSHSYVTPSPPSTKWIRKIFGLLWRFADLWVKYYVCLCIHVENLYPIPCPGDVQQVPGFLSSMLPLKMTGTLLWSPPTPSSESLTCAFKPHTVMMHFKESTKDFWVVVIKGKWCITLAWVVMTHCCQTG